LQGAPDFSTVSCPEAVYVLRWIFELEPSMPALMSLYFYWDAEKQLLHIKKLSDATKV